MAILGVIFINVLNDVKNLQNVCFSCLFPTCYSSTSPSSEANDDVVHCVCGDDTDEGFMIQVMLARDGNMGNSCCEGHALYNLTYQQWAVLTYI